MLKSKEAGKRAENLQKKYGQAAGRHSKTHRKIRSNNSFCSLTVIPNIKFILIGLSTFFCYIPQRKTELHLLLQVFPWRDPNHLPVFFSQNDTEL